MQRDDLVTLNDRLFRVDTIFTDEEGDVCSIVAKCLEPREGDKGIWWAIAITEDDCVFIHKYLH